MFFKKFGSLLTGLKFSLEVSKPFFENGSYIPYLISPSLRGAGKINVTIMLLTHFRSMFPFYTPWKRQKTFGFLTFSGGIESEHWPEMG